MKKVDGISLTTLRRLPMYLNYLIEEHKSGVEFISMPKIGASLGISEILVKKDLQPIISESGKPKVGHSVLSLINDIKDYLGYNDTTKAVLIGCGKLGSALLSYPGFKESNLEIVLAFDNDPFLIGSEINGIKVMDSSRIKEMCERLNIHIGIITVDKDNALKVYNELVMAHVRAIWNFAPINLPNDNNVIVQNENLVSSLMILSKKLKAMLKEE